MFSIRAGAFSSSTIDKNIQNHGNKCFQSGPVLFLVDSMACTGAERSLLAGMVLASEPRETMRSAHQPLGSTYSTPCDIRLRGGARCRAISLCPIDLSSRAAGRP